MNEQINLLQNKKFLVSALFVIVSLGISLWFYPFLPARIPVHFDFYGYADGYATANFWSVYMFPLLQLLVFMIMGLVLKYPQYANIPTTFVFTLLPEKVKNEIYKLIRRMVSNINVATQGFFTYLNIEVMRNAFSDTPRLQTWILWPLVIVLVGYSVFYTILFWRKVKELGN